MFEVSVPDYKQIRICRKEVRSLKHLWDFVNVVTSSFKDWNSTPWKMINVEVTTIIITTANLYSAFSNVFCNLIKERKEKKEKKRKEKKLTQKSVA